MKFSDYSNKAYKDFIFTEENAMTVFTLGLCGESGEVAEKFQKVIRDQRGEITDEFKQTIKKELGDVLWYMNAIAKQLDIPLEDIAKANLDKIESRATRGTLRGSGDNR